MTHLDKQNIAVVNEYNPLPFAYFNTVDVRACNNDDDGDDGDDDGGDDDDDDDNGRVVIITIRFLRPA
jgi:hypothetical protein